MTLSFEKFIDEWHKKPLTEIIPVIPGEECLIGKVSDEDFDKADPGDVVYIPDTGNNDITLGKLPLDDDGRHAAIYEKEDFIEQAAGNEKIAKALFDICKWQSPNIQDILDMYGDDDTAFEARFGESLAKWVG